MRAVRIAACASASLGLAQVALGVLQLREGLSDWFDVAVAVFGIVVVAASVAVVVRLRWARRLLVVLLWLGATGSACLLGVFVVLAWVGRPWPEPQRSSSLLAGGVAYYAASLTVFGSLYLFLRSRRCTGAYGS